jgi:iron complex outermembrane receptor protein
LGDSITTTIRGPYPFFEYRASEIHMRGSEFTIEYFPVEKVTIFSKGAAIRSWNLSDQNYLIFQPADRLEVGIRYSTQTSEKEYSFDFQVGTLMVKKQNRVPEGIDLTEAPDGYMLLNAMAALRKNKGKFRFDFSVEGQNLANTAYRDYLNRFRYFSYDLGRNIKLRLTIPFGFS